MKSKPAVQLPNSSAAKSAGTLEDGQSELAVFLKAQGMAQGQEEIALEGAEEAVCLGPSIPVTCKGYAAMAPALEEGMDRQTRQAAAFIAGVAISDGDSSSLDDYEAGEHT